MADMNPEVIERNNPYDTMPGADQEEIVWSGIPLVRTLAPLWIIGIGMGFWLSGMSVAIVDTIVAMTAGLGIWTDSRIETFDILLPIIMTAITISPAAIWTLERLLTKYELTNQRLLIHWGVLIRRHDEIALQRIRDYRVKRSLYDILFLSGKVKITSRDAQHSFYAIGPVTDARALMDTIRSAALDHKKRMGFREFEGFNREA